MSWQRCTLFVILETCMLSIFCSLYLGLCHSLLDDSGVHSQPLQRRPQRVIVQRLVRAPMHITLQQKCQALYGHLCTLPCTRRVLHCTLCQLSHLGCPWCWCKEGILALDVHQQHRPIVGMSCDRRADACARRACFQLLAPCAQTGRLP